MAPRRRYDRPAARLVAYVNPDTLARLEELVAEQGVKMGEVLDVLVLAPHHWEIHALLQVEVCTYCGQPRSTAAARCPERK